MIGLGNNIKKMREKIGMTQAELGEKIGVSGVAIMRYEKDLREPNINTLQKIASALDVPVTQLLPLDETEKEDPSTPSIDDAEAVSYTHLDVYKRQLPKMIGIVADKLPLFRVKAFYSPTESQKSALYQVVQLYTALGTKLPVGIVEPHSA